MNEIKNEGQVYLQFNGRYGRTSVAPTEKQIIETGRFFLTAGMSKAISKSTIFSRFVLGCYGRHKYQDWGDLSHQDREMNNYAMHHGGRIISSYDIPQYLNIAERLKPQTHIWIITEACRSYTTVLFPSEY